MAAFHLMRRPRRTSRTFSTAIKNIKRNSAALLAGALFTLLAVPVHAQTTSLSGVLAARKAALAALHVHTPKTLEVRGVLLGAGMQGEFHTWETGGKERFDENVGGRSESSLRIGDREYIVNESGNVRELHGLLLRRQHTEDFINGDGFVTHPQYDTFAGEKQLSDGRSVYEIVVAPPDGQPETLDLDAKTLMIDRISYDEEDGTSTEDFSEYSHAGGVLFAGREVDSNGDHVYDVAHYVVKMFVDRPIGDQIFAVPQTSVVQTDKPVTVGLNEHDGHYYTKVRVGSRDYNLLVDTGAQGIVLDSRVAREQGLKAQGHLQVAGTARTGGLGIAKLDAVQIGGVTLPVHSVSILDLRGSTGRFDADGVLGYPFFASAEVTIDPIANTMTFAKPGMLHPQGDPVSVDVDRQLVEIDGKVNGAQGRFLLDTGNSTELLLFSPFMHSHPYLVGFQERRFANDYGIGGTTATLSAIVDELDVANYRLFNRYTNLMQTDRGAFADRFDAGNIGMGVLKNFVVTYDLANARVYMQRDAAFDDGRGRPRYDHL